MLMFFDWPILDPILSIGFTLFILINVIKTITQTIKIFLQSSSDKKVLEDIRNKLISLVHVKAIHYLHLCSLVDERNVFTTHLGIDQMITVHEQTQIKQLISIHLAGFSLVYTTLEFELPEEICRDE